MGGGGRARVGACVVLAFGGGVRRGGKGRRCGLLGLGVDAPPDDPAAPEAIQSSLPQSLWSDSRMHVSQICRCQGRECVLTSITAGSCARSPVHEEAIRVLEGEGAC